MKRYPALLCVVLLLGCTPRPINPDFSLSAAVDPPSGGGRSSTKHPPPKEDPLEIAKQVFEHMQAIFGLIAAAAEDCERGVSDVQAYLSLHQTEIILLSRRGDALLDQQSAEEQAAYERTMHSMAQTTLARYLVGIAAYAQRCPEQMQRINDALGIISK